MNKFTVVSDNSYLTESDKMLLFSMKRFRARMKAKAFVYLRCGAKTAAFLFWASLYMIVMKMTLFKSSVNTKEKDWPKLSENCSKWTVQTQDTVGEDDSDVDNNVVWSVPSDDILLELEKRTETVQKVCQKRKLSKQVIHSEEFFVDHKHKLVWCNIFKAASSSWMYNFNILGGYTKTFLSKSKKQPITLARQKFPRPKTKELLEALNAPGVISLLVVRDPFARLLSAYRDKLELRIQPYYRKLARGIISKYRKKPIKPKRNKTGPSKGFPHEGPTFPEFVRYLIETPENKFNEHWAPYYSFCSPCAVYFNVIAKVETLAKDSQYVIQQLGLGHLLSVKQLSKRRKKQLRFVMNQSHDGRNTTSLLKSYFSQLNETLLNKLLEIYGIDFEMFGYDANVYRSYVKK